MNNLKSDMSEKVRVDLGSRSYDILIQRGLLNSVGGLISEQFPETKCLIVTDENVDSLHGEGLRLSLGDAGIKSKTIVVPAGESSKSWNGLQEVVEAGIEYQLERSDIILAFGGGVVGDLAGFAAACIRRGVRFIQIPTSLLAQVDSSVGGKTGINSKFGKNLVGAFHQPSIVIIDVDLLKSLPERELKAGYAEVVKYGLIDDPDLFSWLENNHHEIFSHGQALEQAIAASCRSKANIVALDETERGNRALLNLGHTFGHALEAFVGYDGRRLVHGEAVSIGITLAHQFSNRLNLCSIDCVQRVTHHLQTVGLPTAISDVPGDKPDADTLLRFIYQDKKVRGNTLTFILTKGIGKAYIAGNVPDSEVLAFLKEQISL